MGKPTLKSRNSFKRDLGFEEIRNKLGLNLAEMGSIFGLSRSFMSLVALGKRSLNSDQHAILLKMHLQFLELEKGIQSDYHSLETRLFLKDFYRQRLPEMRSREKDCRQKARKLEEELQQMKTTTAEAEHAVIVFTSVIRGLEENAEQQDGNRLTLKGLKMYKQKAYDRMLSCREPAQALLQAKIEAFKGEARALRRSRLKMMKELPL